MKRKIFGALALAGVAALGLVGCKDDTPAEFNPTGSTDSPDGYIDAIILYKNNSGMTYQQDAATTLVDGTSASKGDLLPMWKELEKEFGVKFRDAGDYAQNSTKDSVNKYRNDGYKGKDGQNVELVMSTNSLTKDMANEKKLYPLNKHLDKMPHFKEYLEENPAVAAQLYQADGNIYSTPYFDGKDSVEKYLMLNTDYVKMLLDDEYDGKIAANSKVTSYDTSTFNNGNTVYTPFYTESLKGKTVSVVGTDGKLYKLSINSDKNPIKMQNDLASKTGATLVQALKDYIDEAYRYDDATRALYPNRSDVFVSASACYNMDDLVALFRCVKANPKYLLDDPEAKNIEVFFPRSGESNRERQVLELISMFGVRGISAESEKLYFDKNGDLQDMRVNKDAYDAIRKLNEMYQEGLIVQNYQNGYNNVAKNEWRSTLLAEGTGFSSYDYTGTTSPYVDEKSRSASYTAVLPAAAMWDVDKGPNGEDLCDLIHFSEDSRALKDGGWVIPADADADMIDKCLEIMDFMFTDEGADLQDYGPNNTSYRAKVIEYNDDHSRKTTAANDPDAMMVVNGKDCVIIAEGIFTDMEARDKNWNDYYRQFIGSTHGIGHIRSDGLDFETTVQSLRDGMSNVSAAIACGAMYICTTETTGTFFSCAPSSYSINQTQQGLIDTNCKTLRDIWNEDSSSQSTGYTKFVITNTEITEAAINLLLSEQVIKNNNDYYLKFYRQAYEDSLQYIEK